MMTLHQRVIIAPSKAIISLTLLLLLLLSDCTQATRRRTAADTVPSLSPSDEQDLLIGYTLLSDTLRDESKLWALRLLKKLTFRATAREIDAIMDKISTSAGQRKHELAELRKLSPDVSGTPEKMSTIGDAITAAAKDAGTGEMFDWSVTFNLRFMILQAQATRMVAAMAEAIAKQDVNSERKKWLGQIAVEYEEYREEILQVIRKYVRGEGSEQLNPSWLMKSSNRR